mgnify:CR=1 FL=1
MHAVIRSYTGASKLIDEMERKRKDVEKEISGVSGFRAYYAVRDGGTLTAVTICETKAGLKESTQRAADWVKRNLPKVSIGAPKVAEGEVFLRFEAKKQPVGKR